MHIPAFLRWLTFAFILHPACAQNLCEPQRVYYLPPSPADADSASRLPAPGPDPATLLRASRPAPVRPATASLRFGFDSTFTATDAAFGVKGGPVSSNSLQAPAKAQAELERALRAARENRPTEAHRHLDQAIAIYPRFSAAYHDLGVLALLGGDIAIARAHFEKALTLDPQNLYSLFALAHVRLAQGDSAAALTYIDRFLTLAPSEPHGLALLARAQLESGAWSEALRTFDRLDRHDHRGLAEFHLVAGSVYELLKQPQRAIAEYKKYLRENPKSADSAVIATAITELQTLAARK